MTCWSGMLLNLFYHKSTNWPRHNGLHHSSLESFWQTERTQMIPAGVRKELRGQRPGRFFLWDWFQNIKLHTFPFIPCLQMLTLLLYAAKTSHRVLMGLEQNSLYWPDSLPPQVALFLFLSALTRPFLLPFFWFLALELRPYLNLESSCFLFSTLLFSYIHSFL